MRLQSIPFAGSNLMVKMIPGPKVMMPSTSAGRHPEMYSSCHSELQTFLQITMLNQIHAFSTLARFYNRGKNALQYVKF